MTVLVVALLIPIYALMACITPALAEPVQFSSAPVPPTPFSQHQAELRGTVALPRPGDPIAGELYRPVGDGPFPAIIALHGCEGWLHTLEGRQRQAERYVAQGYVILLVDSFGPRGIKQACVPTPGNSPADRLGDAYGAFDWLAARPFVESSRIAILGASQGGNVVLSTLSPSGSALTAGRHFAAGVAFYPDCSPAAAVVNAPLLVLIGSLDDWAPASSCRQMAALPHDGGASERVVVLSGAQHAFDVESIRGHPRDVFGHHLEYSEAATVAANAIVDEFLAATLKH